MRRARTLLPLGRVTAVRQDLCERAFRFATTVLKRYHQLAAGGPAQNHLAQQLLESISSIGANLEEGRAASSRRDMAAKYSIALREARETRYWLRLLASQNPKTDDLAALLQESNEFIAMLTVSVRRLREPTDPTSDL